MNKDYLNAKQAGEMLSLSRSSVYALAHRPSDPLPGRRIGGTMIFKRADIEAWIERQPAIATGTVIEAAPEQFEMPSNVIPMRAMA